MPAKSLIPFGPQHPVFPEPIQLKLTLEDETVVEALPSLGYVHRGLEKLGEQRDFLQNVFLVERVCGICSFIHSVAYCQGVEALFKDLVVPPRAKYLRVVWSELHRLHSHLLWLGLLADSFGFENMFMQAWRIRETILEMLEETGGGRVIISVCQVGGVRRDIPPELAKKTLAKIEGMEAELQELIETVRHDYTVKQRTVNVGVITPEQARTLGAVGPVLRACGIASDHRMTGYAAYGDLGFKTVTATGGDCYARTVVRLDEMTESVRLVKEALRKMPEGEIAAGVKMGAIESVKGNPDGEVVSRVEQPRGEVVYYLRANNTRNLERLRIRTPTFANLAPLLAMLPGCQLADVGVIVLSIDPCISCTER